MNYFIDFEFLEGKVPCQIKNFTIPKWLIAPNNTIQPISVAIVTEDGQEYYAISKDFNLKVAWNRYDEKPDIVNGGIMKDYWIRNNVLLPIYQECFSGDIRNRYEFTYSTMKFIIDSFGKSNKQISEEILTFIQRNEIISFDIMNLQQSKPVFYGYYADYDWVVFCWLFGRMIDLPKGFPMLALDIQQQIVEHNINKDELLKEVPQINCHNSLDDARWNCNAYKWIQNKLNIYSKI